MGRGCFDAISWKSKLVRQLADVNCWMVCLLKCGPLMLFVTIATWSLFKIRSWKPELARCWLKSIDGWVVFWSAGR